MNTLDAHSESTSSCLISDPLTRPRPRLREPLPFPRLHHPAWSKAMHNSSRFQTPATHPHTPPPHAPRPRWPYAHRFHVDDPEDYPSAPVTPSPTDPANMPEPSPILEHPEPTASPSPIDHSAPHDTPSAPPAHGRDDSLPPLPSEAEASSSAVPTTVRLPDPAAATPRHTRNPPLVIAPSPAQARSIMSAETPAFSVRAPVSRVASASHQRQGGSSSDESPVSDHVLLQRPTTAQARPRSGHRTTSSVTYAAQGSEAITHPVRTMSYNSGTGRSRRNDRPERPRSAGLTGVGPDPYGRSTLDYIIPPGPTDNEGDKRDSKMGLSMMSVRIESRYYKRMRDSWATV